MEYDWGTLPGRDVIILKPLLSNIDPDEEFDEDENPAWNLVGEVLHLERWDGMSFTFTWKGDDVREALLEEDFMYGFVQLIDDEEAVAADVSDIMALF